MAVYQKEKKEKKVEEKEKLSKFQNFSLKKFSMTIHAPLLQILIIMAKRAAITNRQRLKLRKQHRLKPYLTGLQLQEWFEKENDLKISLTTVSRTISTKFDWLDTAIDSQLDSRKNRSESWPEFETTLYEWIQRAEIQIPISQHVVRAKAREFWPHFYPETEMPKFSNGWLQRFQDRRDIRLNVSHGEAGSISVNADAEMVKVREIISQYPPKDVFNCDETGLYWRLVPNKSLRTRVLPGRKKDKSRISFHFCTNFDGSERLQPWAIGTAIKPRSFQAAGVNTLNLGCTWRHNKNAWMTSTIFQEWLLWFDKKMTGRNVLLLMDNFSSHISAVRNTFSVLRNTKVVWLPVNSTARYQPLDQGIIHT